MSLTNPLVQAAVGLCATAGTILGTGAVAVWKHRSSVAKRSDEVSEKTDELEEDVLRQIWTLLRAWYVALPDGGTEVAGDATVGETELGGAEQFVDAMRERIDSRELREIVFRWADVEPLTQTLDRALEKYERAYQQVALAAFGVLTEGGLTILLASSGTRSFVQAWQVAYAVIGVMSAASLYRGIVNFNEAESLTDDVF